ncbi:MAG: hypothetical protein JSV36_16085 [Anaerolineae bacterium]|nr:MAG: hypothetical protein JSV36_16085 [Anaerolineae bacterium]
MVNHKIDLRKTVGMALCALLALVAFLAFLILMAYSDRMMAVLGLAASFICPAVWLIILLLNDGDGGGGLVQWVKHKVALLRPAPRRDGQPAGVPVES